VNRYPEAIRQHADELRGRSMMVMRADMFPSSASPRLHLRFRLEGVQGDGLGLRRPTSSGLKESDKLPEPLFTPATKATTGHDINISFEEMCTLRSELSRQLRDLTLRIYKRPRTTRGSAASSSPTPSLNLERPPRDHPGG